MPRAEYIISRYLELIGMKEKALQRKIIRWLKDNGAFVVKYHGGVYTEAGIPDVLCCYKGQFLAFELKVKNNTTTKIQDFKIDRIRKAGGIAEVIRSLDEVKEVIGGIDDEEKSI